MRSGVQMLNGRLHISWLIGWFSLGFVGGVASAPYGFTELSNGPHAIVVAVALLLPAITKRVRWAVLPAVVAGLIAGQYHALPVLNSYARLESFIGQRIEVEGVVAADPSVTTEGLQKIVLRDVSVAGQEYDGSIWVTTESSQRIQRSDTVGVAGFVREGFGTYPLSMPRVQVEKVYDGAASDPGRRLRDWFVTQLDKGITGTEADLGAGIVLGQKAALPEETQDMLRNVGLTHIIVASGYNLTILVRLARRLLARISRFQSLVAALGMIGLFTLITGNSPSMARASLVAVISLVAWYYGKKLHPFILLSFVALLTLLPEPSYAWGDLGWMLSFGSFIGVIVLSPLVHAYFWGSVKPGVIRQVFIETVCAQVLTFPLIIYVFGSYPSLSIIANLLIVPAIPLIMLLVGLSGLLLATIPIAGQGVAFLAQWSLTYVLRVGERLSQLSAIPISVELPAVSIVAMYVLVGVAVGYMSRKTRLKAVAYNVVV